MLIGFSEYLEKDPSVFDEYSLDIRYKEIIDTLNITLFIDEKKNTDKSRIIILNLLLSKIKSYHSSDMGEVFNHLQNAFRLIDEYE